MILKGCLNCYSAYTIFVRTYGIEVLSTLCFACYKEIYKNLLS